MAEITKEMARDCYLAARKINEGGIGVTEAARLAADSSGITVGSAGRYFQTIRGMLAGKEYKSIMSIRDTGLCLEWIGEDDGPEARQHAARAVLKHVEYTADLPKNPNLQATVRKLAEDALTDIGVGKRIMVPNGRNSDNG